MNLVRHHVGLTDLTDYITHDEHNSYGNVEY